MSLNLLSIMDGTKTWATGFTGSELVQVVILGIGIVFFGLICIVLLCSLMSAIMKSTNKPQAEVSSSTVSTAEPIANKQELIAVVSAVIAEDMGTDVEAIRIKSIKRI